MKLSQLHSTSKICEGQCRRGTLAVFLPYTTKATTLAEGCMLVDSLCLSHHMLAEVAVGDACQRPCIPKVPQCYHTH
jgi:hypothetical protein